ncbi:AAA family ATPase [Rhodococcus sp. IEGM 1379]|uniref:AAA family ATPase n=1 Tax=Rhodococcus sp. IEGM 1379 TaxID=3047086 RepID=UPI0024B67FD1|nr:AAA family ATPase [Rhodococcus sp. IEGM 1379]MDI9914080.1 AAA family ATPase [Rhodococcus sp. IEGM 1379]
MLGRTIDDILTRAHNRVDVQISRGAMLADEAGMAATKDLDTLVQIAAQHGAVVRLIGDPAQLFGAFGAKFTTSGPLLLI